MAGGRTRAIALAELRLATNPQQIRQNDLRLGFGGGGWTRTNDLRIMSCEPPVVDKEDKGLSSAESGKLLQNPQPPRNKKHAPLPRNLITGKRFDGHGGRARSGGKMRKNG